MGPWLILHLAMAALLAGLALAVGRWAKLGPATRHALWLVVLLKLLTPPLLAWPWVLPVLPASAERATPTDGPALPVVAEPVDAVAVSAEGPVASSTPAGEAVPARRAWRWSWLQ